MTLYNCSGECDDCFSNYATCICGHGEDLFSPATVSNLLNLKEALENQNENAQNRIKELKSKRNSRLEYFINLYEMDISRNNGRISMIENKLKRIL